MTSECVESEEQRRAERIPRHPNRSPRGEGSASGGEGDPEELDRYLSEVLALPPVKPWPEAVNGSELLEEIRAKITAHVVLPKWGAEATTLWVPHTFAFRYRDITTYLGIESPEHRCGKSTLVTVLSKMTHRAVVSSNVSTPSLYRVVAQIQPTLFIDEADTFLVGNEELRGILNSSYHKETGFVLRAFNLPLPSQADGDGEAAALEARRAGPGGVSAGSVYNRGILRFSCWCPKLIARIGALPTTLADRCIVLRLQRKTAAEPCERLRKFDPGEVKRKCLRFVLDHAAEIAAAEPEIPRELNDRAADIWEPLLVIADLAGGSWPERARNAAIAIGAASTESNPLAVLLFDAYLLFMMAKVERMFSYELVQQLNGYAGRPWKELRGGKPIDERWLARQFSPYGIRPRMMRINGAQARGYCREDIQDVVRRYVPKPEGRRLIDELSDLREEGQGTG